MGIATNAPASLRELADRYTEAWNDHDLDEICALHTPDTAFYIKGVGGEMAAEGGAACREMFGYLLQAWPDQHFELVSLTVRDDWDDFWIMHWVCTGTLALPWEVGGRTFEPKGQRVSFHGNDMMSCEDNRIRVKDSWIDGLAMSQQLAAQS